MASRWVKTALRAKQMRKDGRSVVQDSGEREREKEKQRESESESESESERERERESESERASERQTLPCSSNPPPEMSCSRPYVLIETLTLPFDRDPDPIFR